MGLDQAAIEFYRDLLARHGVPGQTPAGVQPHLPVTPADAIAALANHDGFWQELADGLARHGVVCDLARLRATLAAIDYSDDAGLETQLRSLALPENELAMIRELVQAGRPRIERIRQAFAAAAPAAVARALEQVAQADPPQTLAVRLNRWSETNAGKLTAAGVLMGMLLGACYAGCGPTASNSPDPNERPAALSSTTLYKGVTP